ncbi:MAG: recombinase family protein [Rhizobiales bacterium]|nr:recombinase family protein [Hyphomicrobiales bacterium]
MIYGYARVSTSQQDHAAQVAELNAAGAAKVYAEKVSGAKTDRSQLKRAIAALDAGDVLLVTRIDHLARSAREEIIAAVVGEALVVAAGIEVPGGAVGQNQPTPWPVEARLMSVGQGLLATTFTVSDNATLANCAPIGTRPVGAIALQCVGCGCRWINRGRSGQGTVVAAGERRDCRGAAAAAAAAAQAGAPAVTPQLLEPYEHALLFWQAQFSVTGLPDATLTLPT